MSESTGFNGGFPLLEDLNVDNDKPVELKRREFSSSKGVVSLKSLIESRKAQNLTFYKETETPSVIKLSQRRLSLTPENEDSDEKSKSKKSKSTDPNASIIKPKKTRKERKSKKSQSSKPKTSKRKRTRKHD